jgi:hypothetical protein
MKRNIVAVSMPGETDYKKNCKTRKYARRIFFITAAAVFLASFLASSDSHALIACAPVANNWYCHNSESTAPNVAVDTTSHGFSYFCWCSAGAWVYSGYHGNRNGALSSDACALNCPDKCDA